MAGQHELDDINPKADAPMSFLNRILFSKRVRFCFVTYIE